MSQPQPPNAADPSGPDAPSGGEAAEAALDAVEPERLLPGEDETSVHIDDAIHWAKVYAELLDFKRSLLTVADDHLESMAREARSEVEETDLKLLLAEADRLERRLTFWRTRLGVLDNPAV